MTGSQSEPVRPGRAPEVWGKVPSRNVNFTGRSVLLERLHAGLSTEVTAVVPHALHGLGGVGKTQLAVEYAHRYKSDYDVVWWIPADQPVLVKSSLAGLAPYLGLQAATRSGAEDAAEAVLDALRRGEPFDRWLLVFDNADQPEEISDLIPQGPGQVIITSRNHRWQGIVDTVAVDVFTRDESVEFLSRRASLSGSDADLLAEELGDLPLALEQAGALHVETGISVEDYLRLLKEQTSALLSESKPSEYPMPMTAAWALSVAQLRSKLPEAVDVLRICAFFGPEPIPRDVFRLAGHQTSDARLSGIFSDTILLTRAIRELGRFALATIDSQARTIQVHRLVQALLRDELDEDDRHRYRHEVHLLLAGAAPDNPDDRANWPRYNELIAHILPSQVADCLDASVRALVRGVVYYLYRSGNYQSARTFAEQFVERWTAVSGPDHPDVLIAQRHLGAIIRELGEYRAAYDLDSATLAKMTATLGQENPETLVLSSGFAADLRAVGDWSSARELDERLRAQHAHVFGEDAVATLQIMNNLAVDYGLNSDYAGARALYDHVHRKQSRSKEKIGEADVLNAWNGLARAVRLDGNALEAVALGEEAYAYGVNELDAEHLWTLRTARDLSIAKRRAGDLDASLELAKDVHARLQRIMGDHHPDTVAAASNLSNALRTVGDVDAAYDIALQAVTRYESLYGHDHPYVYGCATNLGILQRLRGDAGAARATNEAALAGLDRRLGRDHHYTLTCALNLASDLSAAGDLEDARRLGHDTLERLRRLFADGYPLLLACMTNHALDILGSGYVEEAESLLEEARQGYAATMGLDHPDARLALVERSRMDGDFDPPPI
ncbi:tetratricopeptide repeat protein [Nonomuraea sp. KC401]|uniref:FxSxx-COOH system tetratricopeptide repeat protein n=1 Tax=unclassified Nonomuraea TaxID=2593643 RepID=UPI0010FCF7E9|nr:FxSxx-COOH system tetratricopeptide repeat protein [Nonomuraea sp. KC401]NBE92238.1 tetratricopeptide repeat protein [Nonomuraea sp. K271]TLF68257.1 tetratricopeptide repeat protein [Nonomuraea sp. KC401]